MTREEAHETDLFKVPIKLSNSTNIFLMGSKKVHELINKIYDDFESKTCDNCKYKEEYRCTKLPCIDWSIDYDPTFGCNKFEVN